jgi:transposase
MLPIRRASVLREERKNASDGRFRKGARGEGAISMRIMYPAVIVESREALEKLEQGLRGKQSMTRVQMLRLLKSRTVDSIKDCAALLGYSERQLLRWWACYKQRGLDALIEQRPRGGRPCRMTLEAWEQLDTAMCQGDIDTLEAARQFLHSTCHITYKSINALSWQFKQRKTKWKTGRRRHRKANPEQQALFKKTSVRR